jgi:hypothetical protein
LQDGHVEDDDRRLEQLRPLGLIIAALEQHHRLIDARIQCLSRNRDAISRYLRAIRSGQP